MNTTNQKDEYVEDDVQVEDNDGVTYQQTLNDDGTYHYIGANGEFDYDPKDWEIQRVPVPTEMNGESFQHNGYMEVLRYIGPETDGSKINIPEGVTNMDMMFMNTNITSAPKIPSSVTSAFAAFASCPYLEVANIKLPSKLQNCEFMFTDCKNLRKGPDYIPSSIDNANYMFAACGKLENTPKIGYGVQKGEYMFAGCSTLTKEPNVPRTMVDYKNMTAGCAGIDAAKDAQAAKQLEKDRAKYEKKLNRKGLMAQIGSGFSFAMQVHAMRQSGYSLFAAPFMVHTLRKNGQLSDSFTNGVAANMMTKGGLQGMLGAKLANHSEKSAQRKQQQNIQKLKNWDNAHAVGQGTYKDLRAQTRANKDLQRGLFERMSYASSQEKDAYKQKFDIHYTFRENIMQKLDSADMLDSRSKQSMSKWYQQQMSSCANYYAEGMRSIQESNMSANQKENAMRGLKELSAMQMEPLMQSAENIQKDYQIFNEGDLRNIKFLTKDMPSEKAKGADFTQRIGETKQDMLAGIRESMLRGMQRSAVTQANTQRQSRGQEAENRFGNMGATSSQTETDYHL